MSFVNVYRVERPNKSGPYRHGPYVLDNCKSFKDDPLQHPTPANDSNFDKYYVYYEFIEEYSHYLFAFKDIEQFLAWFGSGDAIDALSANDFRLNVYKVAFGKVIFGQKQVAFCPRKAVLTDSISLRDVNTYENNSRT